MESKKFLLSLVILSANSSPDLIADFNHNDREYRKLERDIERDIDNEEIIACEIEDNSCVPNDGESLGDSTKCCSGYANSRNICEGRQ